jgi:simple sugar transport system ATP-binding protein
VDLRGAETRIRELSERYGLEVDPRAVIEDLGVSAQQRVEILKMLYRDAELLIFDEPTAMLTPQEIEHLLDIIKRMRAEGKTVVLITHKLEEIKEVADRCAVLNHGRVVAVLKVEETTTAELAAKMVGHAVSLSVEKTAARFGATVLEVDKLSGENK